MKGLLAVAGLVVVAALTPVGAAWANDDAASVVTFHDTPRDVARGHDIRRVLVDNDNHHIRIKVWHRDLRSTRQYSFRLYLNTDLSTSAPEVKVYGAYPNSDYAACTTTTWSTDSGNGCDPEDRTTQCRVDVDVRWNQDATVFDFTRAAQCLSAASAVGVNVSFREYYPARTRWDHALATHVWYPPVPRDT
jgi:hypothetical protein